MCVLILARSLLSVRCAVSLLHAPEIWQFIGEFTQDRSLTNVIFVKGDLYEGVISESIGAHILQKRQACDEQPTNKLKVLFQVIMFIFNILLALLIDCGEPSCIACI
jgi:hypothetical protein